MSVSAAMLAGGQSRRMGTDKSFILLDGYSACDRSARTFGDTDDNHHEPARKICSICFKDVIPDRGSLGGLYSAVSYSQTDYILCVACNMPFLNTDLLHFLIAQRQGYDAIVPRTGEITCGLPKKLPPFMQKQVEQQRLKIAECLA